MPKKIFWSKSASLVLQVQVEDPTRPTCLPEEGLPTSFGFSSSSARDGPPRGRPHPVRAGGPAAGGRAARRHEGLLGRHPQPRGSPPGAAPVCHSDPSNTGEGGGLLHHASIRWVSPRLWALLRGCACVFHGVLRSQHACPPMRHVVAVWASDPCPQEKVKRGREIIKDRDTKSADAGDGGEQPSTAPATYASLHPFRYAYKRTYMFARTSRAPTCLCTNPPRLHPPSSMSSFLFLVCFNFENLWCNTWGGLIAKKVVWRNWGTKSCDVFLCIFWPRLPKIFLLFFGEFSDITPVFDSFAFFPAFCRHFLTKIAQFFYISNFFEITSCTAENSGA